MKTRPIKDMKTRPIKELYKLVYNELKLYKENKIYAVGICQIISIIDISDLERNKLKNEFIREKPTFFKALFSNSYRSFKFNTGIYQYWWKHDKQGMNSRLNFLQYLIKKNS